MTHLPYNPIVASILWGGILLFISGGPTAILVEWLWKRTQPVGKLASLVIVPVWIISWIQMTLLWTRHGTLQRRAAKANDCLGYGQGAMMPTRCRQSMMGEQVTPDGFFFWSAIIFGFAIIGLLVMHFAKFEDHNLKGQPQKIL